MIAFATAFARAAAFRRPSWPDLARRLHRAVLALLDRAAPPGRGPEDPLPPEWFKYPPI